MQIAECRLHYAVFSYSHWSLVSCHSPVVAHYHSLANRHSCSNPAEKQDRKCFSMQLILLVGTVDMINQICQMLSSNKQQHNTFIRFLAANGWIRGINTKLQIGL